MNSIPLISMIAMAGWLVLALSAYRAHRVGMKQSVVMALIWVAIFCLVTAIFAGLSM